MQVFWNGGQNLFYSVISWHGGRLLLIGSWLCSSGCACAVVHVNVIAGQGCKAGQFISVAAGLARIPFAHRSSHTHDPPLRPPD